MPGDTQWPVAGVDEAGRGPLAGAVVAAAVILPADVSLPGLDDSKKLSPRRREALCERIKAEALSYCVSQASVAEIDQLNILQASLLAMQRAVAGLTIAPDLVYVDGNRCPAWHWPSRAVPGGDGRLLSVAAASVLAKVARDGELLRLHQAYPDYGFDRHKGYPTALHREVLQRLGPSPVHRRSFRPVAALLATQEEQA